MPTGIPKYHQETLTGSGSLNLGLKLIRAMIDNPETGHETGVANENDLYGQYGCIDIYLSLERKDVFDVCRYMAAP